VTANISVTATFAITPITPITLITLITPQATADLSITKSVAPAAGPYLLGQQITYTVTVTNNGPDAVTGVKVTDIVPASLGSIVVTPSIGSYAAPTWTIGPMSNGATATLS